MKLLLVPWGIPHFGSGRGAILPSVSRLTSHKQVTGVPGERQDIQHARGLHRLVEQSRRANRRLPRDSGGAQVEKLGLEEVVSDNICRYWRGGTSTVLAPPRRPFPGGVRR